MTPTETEVLKIIWKNKGKAPVLRIARELKISPDYTRVICESLIGNELIEFFEGQYNITNLGRKKLKKLGLLEREKTHLKPRQVRTISRARQTTKLLAGKQKKTRKTAIAKLSNLSPEIIKAFEKKGIRTLEDVATISISRLMEMVENLDLHKAAKVINEARDKLRKKGKEYLWDHNYHGS